jgi:hypothetical protein
MHYKVGAPCAEGAINVDEFVASTLLNLRALHLADYVAIDFSIASVTAFSVASLSAYKAGKASQDTAMAKGAAGAAPHVEC